MSKLGDGWSPTLWEISGVDPEFVARCFDHRLQLVHERAVGHLEDANLGSRGGALTHVTHPDSWLRRDL